MSNIRFFETPNNTFWNSISSYSFEDNYKRSFASSSQKGCLKSYRELFLITGLNFFWKFFEKTLSSNPENDKILDFLRLLLIFETSYQKKLSIRFWPLDLWRFCKKPFVKILKNVGGDRVWVLKIYPKIRVDRHLNLDMVRLGWVNFFWKLQSL